jgi:SAM-dependent methyltransferase
VSHAPAGAPSPWVVRWFARIPRRGPVLDVACGSGRHARLLARHGYPVVAIDRDAAALDALADVVGVTTMCRDLEGGQPWPFEAGSADGIVVTNYLHRPLLGDIVATLAPAGWLIYETFARGHERFGKPSNPDFLLRAGELFEAVSPALRVVAYEHLTVELPRPAVIQRIAAVRPG